MTPLRIRYWSSRLFLRKLERPVGLKLPVEP